MFGKDLTGGGGGEKQAGFIMGSGDEKKWTGALCIRRWPFDTFLFVLSQRNLNEATIKDLG